MTNLLPSSVRCVASLMLALTCASCGDAFPKYNHLDGFRVLAMRASPPTLNEGESTVLDALAFVEGDPNPSLGYQWSWCPSRLPSAAGGDCALDEAGLAGLLGIDRDAIAFDLGQQATATFSYPGQAELYRSACENGAGSEGEEAVVFLCKGGFPINVRVDITYGGQTIRVQKGIRLLFGDLPANRNPDLGAVSVLEVPGQAAPEAWPADMPVRLALGARYQVRVQVDEAAAELFVPEATVVDPAPMARQESLYLSWFVTSGEPDNDRTSFVKDGVSLAEFGRNEWPLPKAGDEPRDTALMFLVLRDERGGVSWLSRAAELTR